jgi:hypothetical protein
MPHSALAAFYQGVHIPFVRVRSRSEMKERKSPETRIDDDRDGCYGQFATKIIMFNHPAAMIGKAPLYLPIHVGSIWPVAIELTR